MTTSVLIPVLLLLTTACATAPAASGPKRRPASQPVLAAGSSAAHLLGRRIVANSGFESLYQVAQLDFRFVVKDAGQTVFEAEHQWDLTNGRDHIKWTDKAGVAYEAWLDITRKKAVGTKDGLPVTDAELDALFDAAYRRYINDTYWLMMPLKLFDPGTRLQAEDDVTIDGTRYRVLRLSFTGVGLTPKDVYRLFIDEGGFRIHRWQMQLQGQSDKPADVTWEDYRPVGPLLLSHRHRIEGTDREIHLEATQAHRNVQENVFVPPPS